MKKKTPLTDAEWRRLFTVRCKSKRGQAITDDESALIDRAFASDPKRYGNMDPDVFNETVPAGSTAYREPKPWRKS